MKGLEKKYKVEKINDLAAKHRECEYFVLDPNHDPRAREALATYIGACYRDGEMRLAEDLVWLLDRTASEPPASQES